MPKSTVSKALRALATALEDLEPAGLEALLAGKGRLVFVPVGKAGHKSAHTDFDVNAVLTHLNACDNRADAQRILESVERKDQLLVLAKSMKVHVVKHDRREDVEKKIIAFAIGGKLRTEAFQTLNLRGGITDPETGG